MGNDRSGARQLFGDDLFICVYLLAFGMMKKGLITRRLLGSEIVYEYVTTRRAVSQFWSFKIRCNYIKFVDPPILKNLSCERARQIVGLSVIDHQIRRYLTT